MFANHPDIAKRWHSEFGSYKSTGKNTSSSRGNDRTLKILPTGTPSNETNHPSTTKLPRPGGFARDFAGLKPSHSARFKPKSKSTPNLVEAEKSGPVEYHPNSRHSELGTAGKHTGLRLRDVRQALKGRM